MILGPLIAFDHELTTW